VQGKKAGDEGITSPGRNHVPVEKSAESSPQHVTLLQRLDPEVKGEDKQENCNGFVVVAAGNRTRDVARGNSHKQGSQETSRIVGGHLIGKEIGSDGGKTGESWRKEDADIPDIHRDREGSEGMVNDTTGHHEAGVEGASRDTSQGVPCPVIEPIPKVGEAVRDEVLGCSEVEPGVDWSDVSTAGRGTGGGRMNTDIRG
jgi:hypothetical protein